MSFSQEIVEHALVESGRHCCICHKLCGTKIETHHIKPTSQGGADDFENCIPLCFDCHAEVNHYNVEHPRGRKFTPNELKKHRDNWFNHVRAGGNVNTNPNTSQSVSGTGNMVAGRDLYIKTERIIHRTTVQIDPGGKHISNPTALKIQELVKEFIDLYSIAGNEPARAAKQIWSKLKKEFEVTTYKEILAEDSERVIKWLYAQIAMARPKIRKKAPEAWARSLFKPIHTRANELGIDKDTLYKIAFERIPLKKPIQSLKELTQRDLQKLHRIMIYEVKKTRDNLP